MVDADQTKEIKKIFKQEISLNLKMLFLFLKTGTE